MRQIVSSPQGEDLTVSQTLDLKEKAEQQVVEITGYRENLYIRGNYKNIYKPRAKSPLRRAGQHIG